MQVTTPASSFPIAPYDSAAATSFSRQADRSGSSGGAKLRRRHHKAQDGERVNATGSREPANVLPLITALVTARPTCGYRRITALVNRQLRARGTGPVNHKRVSRIMKAHNLLLARRYTERPEQTHKGKVVTMRSNIRSPLGSDHVWMAPAGQGDR